MKIVLLTGCPGRLANALLNALLRNGYEVRLAIKLGLDASALPKKASKRLFLDLADAGEAPQVLLQTFCKGVDYVVHVHGLVDYLESKQVLMRENYETTKNLLNACKAAGGIKKFVYTSSTSVYRKPTRLPIDESQEFTPINYYGESKVAAEQAVRESRLPYVIIRPTIIAGAEYIENFRKFIQAAAAGKAKLIGDGSNRIAWVHVDDVVQAFLLALTKSVVNEDFIVASDEAVTQKQAYEILCKQLRVHPPSKIVSKKLPYAIAKAEKIAYRLTGRKPAITAEEVSTICENRFYDVSKAKKLLGWKPRRSFKQAVKEMITAWAAIKRLR